ncbi:MAG: hypothetical protein ACUVRA_08870, partial [Candidatus Bathyarchaeaceae archaeon]
VSKGSFFQVFSPPRSFCKVFVSGKKISKKTKKLEATCITEKRAPEMIALIKASKRGIPTNMSDTATPKLVITS